MLELRTPQQPTVWIDSSVDGTESESFRSLEQSRKSVTSKQGKYRACGAGAITKGGQGYRGITVLSQ